MAKLLLKMSFEDRADTAALTANMAITTNTSKKYDNNGGTIGRGEGYQIESSVPGNSRCMTLASRQSFSSSDYENHHNVEGFASGGGLEDKICGEELDFTAKDMLTVSGAYSLRLSVNEIEYLTNEDEPSTSTGTLDKQCASVDCSLHETLCFEKLPPKDNGQDFFGCPVVVARRKHQRKRRLRYSISARKLSVRPLQKPMSSVEQSSFHRPNFINTVIMGGYEMDTWFWSPYPNECVSSGTVYICEKCLELKRSKETLQSHNVRCNALYPPGDEIFRQADISVFEVDGEKAKIYCQHLCMLGKLFIDHKALFYDVEPFLFYVATIRDSSGFHFVGYFSKQKHSEEKHNLSCIVTLPCYQERGFGRFLIDFSFLLTRREKILGSAEKPLSDLGLIAYRSYWRTAILEFLYLKKERDGDFCHLSVDEIARATGIEHEDVLQTLNRLEMLSVDNDSLFIDINFTAVRSHWEKAKNDPRRIWIDESNLRWKPKL